MMDPQVRRFDKSYEEDVVLRDGRKALIRLIRPSDKALLAKGFDKLSPESRYRRFLSTKDELSDAELRYLTEVDGENHFALGIGFRKLGLFTDGIGIGRFVRLKAEPTVAEPAVAVLDDHQGNGVGTILLQRLMEAAAERGIRSFRSEVLASNDAMKHVLEDLSPDATFQQQGDGIVIVNFPIDASYRHPETAAALDHKQNPLQRLLSMVAGDRVSVVPTAASVPPPKNHSTE